MGFNRRKDAEKGPSKRSLLNRTGSRDPFEHLSEERARAEEGEPWFLAPEESEESSELGVQAGVSSNLAQDDLDDLEALIADEEGLSPPRPDPQTGPRATALPEADLHDGPGISPPTDDFGTAPPDATPLDASEPARPGALPHAAELPGTGAHAGGEGSAGPPPPDLPAATPDDLPFPKDLGTSSPADQRPEAREHEAGPPAGGTPPGFLPHLPGPDAPDPDGGRTTGPAEPPAPEPEPASIFPDLPGPDEPDPSGGRDERRPIDVEATPDLPTAPVPTVPTAPDPGRDPWPASDDGPPPERPQPTSDGSSPPTGSTADRGTTDVESALVRSFREAVAQAPTPEEPEHGDEPDPQPVRPRRPRQKPTSPMVRGPRRD